MTTLQDAAVPPGHTEHPALRAAAAVLATMATVAVLVLAPGESDAYAADLGPLRQPGEAAFIAAHRGDRSSAPENTVPAFEAAVASGSDFLEADLRQTLDGYAVVIHDDTVDRTTDGTGAVGDLTLAQMRELDAGGWYSGRFIGAQVPVFAEFLDIVATSSETTALVELKGTWTPADVASLLGDVYFRGVQDRLVFASFSPVTVTSLREAAPAIPRVLIRRVLPLDPVAVAARYDAIAIMTRTSSLQRRPDAVGVMHAGGLGVLLYTLNTEERWGEALSYGVDGIVTDEPSALDEWIAQTAPGT